MKLQLFRSALLLVLVGIPALAKAEETIPQHGLWTKVGLGASSASYTSSASVSDPDFGGTYESEGTISGAAPDLRGDFGAVVSPGTILHASLGFSQLKEPELESKISVDGDVVDEGTGKLDETIWMRSLSAGLTHYFGEASITVRGGYAATITDDETNEFDPEGFLFGAGLSYDFVASGSSRFGVGVNVDHASLDLPKSAPDNASLGYTSFGLFLNGTFY